MCVTGCPEAVPRERLAAVGEYLGLVNEQLDVGSFELNWQRGVVRRKTSLDLGDAPATPTQLEQVILPDHEAILHDLPALRQVLAGELSPADAFDEAMNR